MSDLCNLDQRREHVRAEAHEFARAANENYFDSHYGTFRAEGGLVCLFSNRGSRLWAKLLSPLRARLSQGGYTEVVTGEYPEEGNDRGYTGTMVVRLPHWRDVAHAELELAELLSQALRDSLAST